MNDETCFAQRQHFGSSCVNSEKGLKKKKKKKEILCSKRFSETNQSFPLYLKNIFAEYLWHVHISGSTESWKNIVKIDWF